MPTYNPPSSYQETRFLTFWNRLHLPHRLERQHQIGPFYVDFAHLESRVVIEIDGKAFHSTAEQLKRDQERQGYIECQGWSVIRFTGNYIYHYPVRAVRHAQRLIERKIKQQ